MGDKEAGEEEGNLGGQSQPAWYPLFPMGRVRKWGRRGKVVVPEPRMMEGVRGNMRMLEVLGRMVPGAGGGHLELR